MKGDIGSLWAVCKYVTLPLNKVTADEAFTGRREFTYILQAVNETCTDLGLHSISDWHSVGVSLCERVSVARKTP